MCTITWEQHSIAKSPEDGRGASEYEDELNLELTDLEGHVVLDLGCGPGALLANGMRELKIDACVISLSPDFVDDDYDNFERVPGPEARIRYILENPVAGLAEQLPIKTESCDDVLALYSIAEYAYANWMQWIPEICRVLKHGGTARIGPVGGVLSADQFFGGRAPGRYLIKPYLHAIEELIGRSGCEYSYVEAHSEVWTQVLVIAKPRTAQC